MSGSWGRDLYWHVHDTKCDRRHRRRQARAAFRCIANDQTEPETEEPCCAFAFRTLAELVTDFKHRLREREKAKAAQALAESLEQAAPLAGCEQLYEEPAALDDCEFELVNTFASLHIASGPTEAAQSDRIGAPYAAAQPMKIGTAQPCNGSVSRSSIGVSRASTNKVRPRGHCCYCGIPAFIPYADCNFCGDQPSYHHGRCCPNRSAQPEFSSTEELGSAQLADSFVTQEPLFELDTQPLLAPPPPELSYRQKKSEEWFTRCHRAGPDLPTARSSACKPYDEHFPLPRVRL
jgi:hypothetical protein